MKKLIVAALAYIGLMAGAYGTAEANLITNGSFEDPTRVISGFMTLGTGSGFIPGWSVQSGSIDWIGTYWQASEGKNSIDLAGSGDHGLIVGTSFATEIGKTYRVQFDMAGNPDRSYDKSLVAVSTGDASGDAYVFTFGQTGNTKTDMGWEPKFFDFVADSTISELKFGDWTGDMDLGQSWGAALDNVSVDLAPVPEPGTIVLLGAGLLGLGFYGRRRIQK